MKILIMHRIPYFKIEYHRGINHQKHHVTYIGKEEIINTIPQDIKCHKVIISGHQPVENEIYDYIQKNNLQFDHIISLSEYELLAAATLREWCGIKGATKKQVELVRNKLIMKQALQRANISVPEFLSLTEFMINKPQWHGKKIILKPVDGASSENVILFDNTQELIAAVENKKTGIALLDNDFKYSLFEVETFIKGDIIHIDGLVKDKKILTSLASQYVGNCLDYAKGQPLGSIQIDLTPNEENWVAKCIAAVRIEQGSFHLEAIRSAEGLVFLEIANRVGGADVVKTFEFATGIHLPSEELKILLNEKVTIENNKPDMKFGWFVFPGHLIRSGHVINQYTEQFKYHAYIKEWYELTKDQLCSQKITYQPNEVPIAGVVKANTADELITFMRKMFSVIQVIDRDYKKVA